MTASTFTFNGFAPPEGADPLGVWNLSPYGVVTYAADDRDEGLVWRVGHPDASRNALSALRAQLDSVEAKQRDLDTAAQRLAGLALVPGYGVRVEVYEAELLDQVSALQVPVAFTTSPEVTVSYRRIYEQADVLVTQFRRLIQNLARVETQIGGQSIALTTVDWTGDYQTTWLDGVAPLDMALHMEAVRLALASRRALLRLVTVVTSGALNLALKAAVPGGQILLIPAVYNFIRNVLRELEQLPDGWLD